MKVTVERTPKSQTRATGIEAANAAASQTATYYNGGVEGPAFERWYLTVLAPQMAKLPPAACPPATAPKARTSVVRVERNVKSD
jgi:hypothetical protein